MEPDERRSGKVGVPPASVGAGEVSVRGGRSSSCDLSEAFRLEEPNEAAVGGREAAGGSDVFFERLENHPGFCVLASSASLITTLSPSKSGSCCHESAN